MDATETLSGIRLLPVVVIDDAGSAVPLAKALLSAGIRAIEITLRTDAALKAMENIAKDVPDILVGAGSVRHTSQFAQLKNVGAAFAVSPGATDELLAAANMPYVPGIATASESLRLMQAGYLLQKFFPAEVNGGIPALKALSAPIPEVHFCPTGGVNASNAKDYLSVPAVSCVGGSWFVPQASLQQKNFSHIEELAKLAMDAIND